MITIKKKNVSKKKKSSWRKHVDVSDVDNFLEDKRLQERLGGDFDKRPDNDLFIIDTKARKSKKPKRKATSEDAPLPPIKKKSFKQMQREKIRRKLGDCFPMLKSHSKVKDPIRKRNKVRTPEQRKDPLVKKIEQSEEFQQKLKEKAEKVERNRNLAKQRKLERLKKTEFDKDVWSEGMDDGKKRIISQEWLNNDTKRHNLYGLGKINKHKPETVSRRTTGLPAIEAPHPGMSYNPSYQDHHNLLQLVAEKESKIIKTEKHLTRVTKGMFSRVTEDQKQNAWMNEMSQGIPSKAATETDNQEEESSEDEAESKEYKSVNPPVVNKKKTLKQRRIQKEQRFLAQSRTIAKKEKKKAADIYKLRKMHKDIEKAVEDETFVLQKRKKAKAERIEKGTLNLGARKFDEPDLEFNMGHEIKGNLRNLKKAGDLLRDRFTSLAKRNVLAVTAKATKKKAKVKKFVKKGHKEDDWKTTVSGLKLSL